MGVARSRHFPSISVTAAVGDEPAEDSILSFQTPQLEVFAQVNKNALYAVTVKFIHQ